LIAAAERGVVPRLMPPTTPPWHHWSQRWQQVESYVREFLSRLRDEDLDRTVEFAIGSSPKQTMRLGELMHHAANHAVHHRGQVALLLRVLGYAPGSFDILLYYPRRG